MPSVCVCLCSRGLVHSRTVEAVLDALAYADQAGATWAITHDKPIPDAQNTVTQMALATGAAQFWFVEEDMQPPPTGLIELLKLLDDGADVAALDYSIGDKPDNCAAHNPDGSLLWVGMGCMLVKRRVFEVLPAPWFRSDVAYRLTWRANEASLEIWPEPVEYGGQDIYFSQQCREAGLKLAEVKGLLAGHLALVERGQAVVNNGCHTIVRRPPPERFH